MARAITKPTNDVYTGMLITIVVAQVFGILYFTLDITDYSGTAPQPSVTLPKSEPLPETVAAAGAFVPRAVPQEIVPPPAVIAAKPEDPKPAEAPPPAPLPPVVAAKPAEVAPAVPAGPVPSPLSVPAPPRRTVPVISAPAAPAAPRFVPAAPQPSPSPLNRR